MKKFFTRIVLVIAVLGGSYTSTLAQCTIGTGINTNYGIVNPGCDTYVQTPTNFGPGQYAEMPMLIGGSYTINTCGNGTYQGYDTQITVRRTNNNVLGYNDDCSPSNICGTSSPLGQNFSLNSYLDLTGIVNEYVRVGVKRYNCQPNANGSSSIYVRFRQNNNLSWGTTPSQACEGATVALVATPAPNANSIGAANKGTYTGFGISGTNWTAPSVSVNSTYTITYTFGACAINRTMTSLAYPNAIATLTGDLTPCTNVGTLYTASASQNATSYEWQLPSGWTGTSTSSTITVTPSATSGTLMVRGVNSCGAGPWTSVALDPVNPIVSVTNNAPVICSGQNTALLLSSSESGSTYSWTVTTSGSISGATNVTGYTGTVISQTLLNTGSSQGSATYNIYATAGGCDGPIAAVTVLIDPQPNGSIGGTTTICDGSSTNITFNISAGSGPFDVNYNDGSSTFALLGILNGHSVTVSPSVTTTYSIVSIDDALGCTNNASFGGSATVTVNEKPNGTISAVSPVCDGDTTTLTFNFSAGTGPYNIIYTDGSSTYTETGIINGATASHIPTGATTYNYVSIEDANGCFRTSGFAGNASVLVTPLPVVTLVNSASQICSGEVTAIGLSSSVGGSTYSWSTVVTGSVSGQSDGSGFTGSLIAQTLTNTGTTQGSVVYNIYANAASCDGPIASTTVLVDPLPGGSLSGTTTICEGTSTDLTFNFTVGTAPFIVSYTDGSTTYVESGVSDGQTVSVSPVVTTTYSIVSIVDANGCTSTIGFGPSVVITVDEAPDGTIALTSPVCQGDSTTITFTFTVGTGPYNITFSDGVGVFTETGISSGATVTLVPPTTVTYNYLSIEDANGCTRTSGFAGNAQVVVNPIPFVSFSGLASDYCVSDIAVSLIGNHAPSGTFSGSGITDGGNGTATFDPAAAGVGSHAVTYAFTDINSCYNESTQSTNVDAQPVADAGSGGNECDLDFTFSAAPTVGTAGTWTMISGAGVPFFSNVNGDTSSVQVSTYGTYVFQWEEINGQCSDQDTLTVNFYEQPVSDAGNGGSECDLDFGLSANASAGIGTWSQSSGPGTSTYGNANDAATTVTVSIVGTYEFIWTEVNGTCSDSDTISVDFFDQPVADAGSGGNECDLDFTFSASASFGSGTWTQVSGPGTSTFTNANLDTTGVSVDAYGTYVYQWEEVNGTCSDTATVTVNYYEQPTANAGLGGDECDLNFLLGATGSVGTGTWTQTSGPGTSTFGNANSGTTLATADTYGTYTYQWGEVNGTCSDSASVTVNYYEQPTANAGLGGNECDLDFDLGATLSTGSGLWTAFGPGNATFGNDTVPVSSVSVDSVGTYIFTWTETNGICIDVDTISVTFFDQPSNNAGIGGDECDLDFVLNATSSFVTGTWTQTSGSGFSNFIPNANDPAATVTVSQYDTYNFTWTEVNGVCSDNGQITVNFYEQPVADAGNGGSECDLDFGLAANASVGTGTWSQTTGPGTSTYGNANDAATTVTVSIVGTYEFIWTEVNGTCSDSDTISVDFFDQPVADAGSGGNECDLDFTFSASASFGSGTWTQVSGPGTSTFTNANLDTTGVSVDAYGTYVYQWEEVNGTCSDTATVTVNYYEQPTANAGLGGDECDLNFLLSATGSVGTGTWTQTSGPGTSTFGNANVGTTLATADAYGTYTYQWEEVNGTCSDSASVTVNYYEQPTANAGLGGNECDLDFDLGATLSTGSGQWTASGPGNATFGNDTVPVSSVSVDSVGTYIFTWTETNGVCVDVDSVSVNFYNQPVADAGSGGDECDLNFDLNANASFGTGTWTQTFGPGFANYVPNANDPAATVTVSQYGAYQFTWTEVNGVCSDDDNINVTFYEQPVANAGLDGNECDLDFILGAVASVGNGEWTQVNGPGISAFIDGTDPATTVTVTMVGQYEFQWEEVNGTCSDDDIVVVNFFQQPVADAGFGGSECDLDYDLSANPSVGMGTWTYTGPGAMTFTPNENDPNATATVDSYGIYVLTWTEDNFGCTDNASITINYNQQTTADAGAGGDECDLNFMFNATPSIGNGVWTYSGPGSAFFSADTDPTAIVTVDTYGSYLFTWTETNGTCVATDQVTVNFYEQPFANAGTGGNECDLNFQFSAVSSVGNGLWLQTAGPGTSTFTAASDPVAIVTVTQFGTYEFTWSEVNGTCTDDDVITVVFYEQPVADAGIGGDECDLDFDFTGSISSGSGSWSFTGPGTASFSSIIDPATDVTVSTFGTYEFTWTEVNGTCSDNAAVTVNFYEQPVADAGVGGQECDLNFLLSASPSFGNGVWSMTSGPGNASFGNATSATSLVDVDAFGTYQFTWTETNGSCSDFATVSVDFYEQPVADAGLGGDECDLDFVLAATASVGNGAWTYTGPGTATFGSATSASTTVDVSVSGTYTFTWTETNGVCSDASDAIVNFYDQPVANAGIGGDECDLNFTFNGTASFGTGTWTTSGPGNASFTNVNSATSSVTVDTYGSYTFTWTEVNGICSDDASVTVNFYEQPVSNPGMGEDQCDLDYTFNGTASVGVGTWTYTGPGTATFTSVNDVNATVTVDATGNYSFTWTEDNNGCTSAAVITMNFNALPIVSFSGLNGPYCIDQSTPVPLTGSPAGGTFTGLGVSGNSFVPSVAGVGTIFITYTYTDVNGCTNNEEQTVDVNGLPNVSFSGLDAMYCEDDANAYALNGTPAGGTFSGPGISGSDFVPSIALAGAHTITYTYSDVFGCESFEEQTVTVNELPIVSFSGLDAGYCEDAGSATLVGLPAGGTFSGPGISGSDFDPATAGVGVLDVTYTYSDGNGCENSTTQSVEVYELPQPVVTPNGSAELCEGSTLTLDAGAGYATYDWDGLGNDQTLDVTTAGTYAVTVTTADGCSATSTATVVSVNPLPIVDLGPDTTVCTGGSVMLDAGNSGAIYSWSTFENSQTITVNATNNYSVTVTDANGCIASDDINLQIQGDLTPIIVALGPAEFCAGETVTLDAGAQYTNFLWNNNETTQTITVNQSGIYEVVVEDQFGCSGASQPFLVNVWQLPNAVIVPDGPTNICEGDTVTLAASNAFADYLWTPNSEVTQEIQVTQSGSYTVIVTDPVNGCVNESAPMVVAVNTPVVPTIVANGPLEFCDGETVVLDAGTGFNSYLWTSGSTNQSITVTETGDYGVTVLDENNCIDSSLVVDPIHVEVWDPTPNASQQGDSIVVGGGPFATYQWYHNGTILPGETGPVLHPSTSGVYNVVVVDEHGCSAESNFVEFTFIGIAELSDISSVQVFPNPNKGRFVFKATFDQPTKATITIMDALGKILKVIDYGISGAIDEELNINRLPNGVYQIRLSTEKLTVTKRVMKI